MWIFAEGGEVNLGILKHHHKADMAIGRTDLTVKSVGANIPTWRYLQTILAISKPFGEKNCLIAISSQLRLNYSYWQLKRATYEHVQTSGVTMDSQKLFNSLY